MPVATIEKFTATSKDTVESLTQSGKAVMTGLAALAKAYQDMTTRNIEKLSASFTTLSSIKSPTEFFAVQQKMVRESFESAIADSRAIAELTSSVFTAAFEPVQKQVVATQQSLKKVA